MFLQNKLSENSLFVIFYTVMHIGILTIPNAIYWDDWVLYQATLSELLDRFNQAGALFGWSGYLHYFLLSVGPWSYKVLTFVLMLAAGLLLNLILKRNGLLTNESRIFVVLLFLLLPFNMARVALIDFPYTVCYFLFFLAWHLIDRHRLLALALFFMSFNTNSLLVFYALPILDMMYRDRGFINVWSMISFARCRMDFLILPPVYFYIKTQYFPPYGVYAGYNEAIHWQNILPAMYAHLNDFTNLNIDILWLLAIAPFVWWAIKTKVEEQKVDAGVIRRALIMLAVGMLGVVLGAIPYWALGYVPTFNEWTSRHQLLLSFGVAMVLIAFVHPFSKLIKITVMAVIISGSISYGWVTYYSFYIDWNKQQQLIREMSNIPVLQKADLVIVKDNTADMNAIKRSYRFYEWNGIMRLAFGEQNRFGISMPSEISQYTTGSLDQYFTAAYRASGHVRKESNLVAFMEVNPANPKVNNSYRHFEFLPSISIVVTPAIMRIEH